MKNVLLYTDQIIEKNGNYKTKVNKEIPREIQLYELIRNVNITKKGHHEILKESERLRPSC